MYLNKLYFIFFIINIILIELLFKDTNPYIVTWVAVWSVSVVILDKMHSEKTLNVRVVEDERTKLISDRNVETPVRIQTVTQRRSDVRRI